MSERIFEFVFEATCIGHQLFRHAAANDARAADSELLGNHDFSAVAGRDAGRPHASGARTYDEKIDVEFSHDVPQNPPRSLARKSYRRRRRELPSP